MAHSYPNLLIHCVFSTKERRDSIPKQLREKLWKYLAVVGENHKLPVLEAGGTSNHAHLLLALPADVPLSKAVQTLKANSSRWMGEHGIDFGGNKDTALSALAPQMRIACASISGARQNIIGNIRSKRNSSRCSHGRESATIPSLYLGDAVPTGLQ